MKFRIINNIEGEIWKEIPKLEGKYFISNFGRIKSYRNRYCRTSLDKDGYERILLKTFKNKISYNLFIHRLVAEAFIPNLESKEQVNHKDGYKTNNIPYNLEWVTNIENRNHAIDILLHTQKGEKNGNAKLTKEEVNEIKLLNPRIVFPNVKKYSTPKGYVKNIAEKFKVCSGQIHCIWRGAEWNHD